METTIKRDLAGYFFILMAATCWGFIGIFSGLAFAEGVAPMEVAFWRAVLAWLCFALQAVIRREMHLDFKDIPLLALFSVFGITLFYVSYQFAVKTGGAALAAVLLYTAPGWVVLIAYFLFREPLTRLKILAVLLVVVGVFFISTGGGAASAAPVGLFAIAAGLTAGFCYSLYYIIGKHFSTKYTSANLFSIILPLGALCIFPFVSFSPKSPTAWACLIGVSVVSTFIANICYYKGVTRLEAGRASVVATLEPVVAAIAAYLFFGEYFTPLGYLGAALIVSAVLVTIFRK